MVSPAPSPAVTIAKAPQAAGILPVSTTGAKPKVTGVHRHSKHHATGLKINIRRLPPGLTEEEFQAALGADWKLGSPNVDWYYYVKGKVSKDAAKPSRPARAYMHLTDAYVKEHAQEPLKDLQTKIASASFLDAKGTYTDPCLLMPWPTAIEAPYHRVPSTKIRKDNRQGTIDQERDFIDFLQELTNPLIKPTPIDSITEKEHKPEEKIVTPLVQYLRDKKANKIKDSSSSGKKHGRLESKEGKTATDKKSSSKSHKDGHADKKSTSKSEKPTKETIKVMSKPNTSTTTPKAQTASVSPSTSKGAATASSNTSVTSPATAMTKPERKRERGSIAAAAKMLRRDLEAGSATSRRRKEANSTETSSNVIERANAATAPASDTTKSAAQSQTIASSSSQSAVNETPTVQNATKGSNSAKPNQPSVSSRNNTQRNQAKSNAQTSKSSKTASTGSTIVTPNATEAFLKHANPSQGITESLLQATFAGFGVVTKVEIDKKKGFGYLDFAEPSALQKAIAASPVKIAEGSVVVLERRAPSSSGSRAGRGEGRGEGRSGRSGATNSSQRSGHGRGRGGRQGTDVQGQAGSGANPNSSSVPPAPNAPDGAKSAGC